MSMMGIARSFSRWVEFLDERCEMRRVTGVIIQRMLKGSLTRAFGTWLGFVDTLHDNRAKMTRIVLQPPGLIIARGGCSSHYS